jgi:hypothetical protein
MKFMNIMPLEATLTLYFLYATIGDTNMVDTQT